MRRIGNPRLIFFLRARAGPVRRRPRKVEGEKLVLAPLPELSLRNVEFAREPRRITMGGAIRLTDGNRTTLKPHFRALAERGHLCQLGPGRGVWYAALATSLCSLSLPMPPLAVTRRIWNRQSHSFR